MTVEETKYVISCIDLNPELCSLCTNHSMAKDKLHDCRSRKLYVVLSAVLCLLASSLVAFFLFPRSVVVVDDGIRSVSLRFDHTNMRVLMNMTVR